MIYKAITDYVERDDGYRPSGRKPRLWAGDVGYCTRRAIMRIQGWTKTVDFDLVSKIRMKGGVMWEAETGKALKYTYGADNVNDQLSLGTVLWSGKVDFVLFHGTPDATLIEHKATGDKWWNYKNGLPKDPHLLQLLRYYQMYQDEFDNIPKLILFYRSWGHYAEFEIHPVSVTDQYIKIRYNAMMDDEHKQGWKKIPHNTQTLEEYYHRNEPGVQNRTLLPTRLSDPDEGCTFRGEPSCKYYYHCYPYRKEPDGK